MQDKNINRFDSALYALPHSIACILKALPEDVKDKTQEIRLRTQKPLCLTVAGRVVYINKNGFSEYQLPLSPFIVSDMQVAETVKNLCNNSMYSHSSEMNQGYISMRYGHRAGIAGNFSGETVYNFSSVNIRIARQILGAADFLADKYRGGGVLIAGPPGSGKTTVLRDFIRQLSNGAFMDCKRVAVIDTRGELSAHYGSYSQNDLGVNTDVLYGIEKPRGVEIALRTLSPDIIAFDEIGTSAELEAVSQCMCAGADVILTAHIGKIGELSERAITRKLLLGSYIKTVAILHRDKSPEILSKKELERCLF